MRRLRLASEFVDFLLHRKKYWLIPVAVILLLLGIVVVFTSQSALAPLIYTLF